MPIARPERFRQAGHAPVVPYAGWPRQVALPGRPQSERRTPAAQPNHQAVAGYAARTPSNHPKSACPTPATPAGGARIGSVLRVRLPRMDAAQEINMKRSHLTNTMDTSRHSDDMLCTLAITMAVAGRSVAPALISQVRRRGLLPVLGSPTSMSSLHASGRQRGSTGGVVPKRFWMTSASPGPSCACHRTCAGQSSNW